jgi:hypothetical protein
MKRSSFLLLGVVLAMVLIAASPFPARFTVINQTGADIFVRLSDVKSGNPDYPLLTVTIDGTVKDAERPTTVFTIERKVYDAQVFACGKTALGKIDLTRNLQLNFVSCDQWWQTDHPRFLGEPSQEKPNWFLTPGMADWRFVFPAVDASK